ncbi:hypothetical protein YTPLAS18_36750 [Nitrospira sp.]|nr:hypothetical protein YTPLAS18_36750 [Nitrospira sp.]
MTRITNDASRAQPVIPWWAGGAGIGLVLIAAVGLLQPIGVSTQYVVLDGVFLHATAPELAARSTYLSELAEGWSLATYEFAFVGGIPLGAWLSAWLTGRFSPRLVPEEWKARFGPSPVKRLAASFAGGFLLLFGARLGGGCTSGHMISGISQLALSSFVFSAAVFLGGIVTARWLYPDHPNQMEHP